MANLPLKTRRMLARGFNRAQVRALGGRTFRGIGNRSTLTTSLAGANNDLTFIARTPGTAGNALRVAIVVAGNNTPLSVSVAGNDITINSATGAAGAVTSTGADVVRVVNASPTASLKVWASVAAPGNDGTGLVAALALTNLAGAA